MTVDFPLISGARPTTPALTRILSDAAEPASADLRRRVLDTRAWRTDYATLLANLTSASADTSAVALAVASAGIDSARYTMTWSDGSNERVLTELDLDADRARQPGTAAVYGTASPIVELRVPYRGRVLRGSELLDQVDSWVSDGIAEPSFGAAIARVVANPDWLAVRDRQIVLLGAGAELSPLEPLTAWGADVLAVDVPSPDLWERIVRTAQSGAGSVRWPLRADGPAGLDLVQDLRELAAWLASESNGSPQVLSMYAYADRGAHVRLSVAADLLATHLCEADPRTALAYLATPTDAFVVPSEVVRAGSSAWQERGRRQYLDWIARTVSGGTLFRPSYTRMHEDGTGLADVLVPQQGPSYAMAKRLQRWRGVLAEDAGHTVSFNVAPASWTRSVTRNRALAAAYRGAHHFDVEVFGPDTCRILMAALLVHDLHHHRAPRSHPEALFSDQALHGGLWRAAYEPKSALGFAALLGTFGNLFGPGKFQCSSH
ncbi:hypothetical protein ACFVAV_07975 [Nocardia sp. NPDC057663]|uniref:hypothetical protein n=1 Tax=Nocardia sp. NPDC057663 TaxID=3346201 RepID=UPI003672B598